MTAQYVIESYVNDVVRQLPRKLRHDVGIELRELLTEDHTARQEAAGHRLDEKETMAFLNDFGRPDEVAARYQPAALHIIDPIHTWAFIRAAIVGILVIWALTLISAIRGQPDSGMAMSVVIGAWWARSVFLTLFWWLGFLGFCFAIASWARRRAPQQTAWRPHNEPSRRVLRIGTIIFTPLVAAWLVFLIAPAWFLGLVVHPGIDLSWVEYAESFRQWRLAPLLALIALSVVLNIRVAILGRWTPAAQWADIALALAIASVMLWSLVAGPIFQSPPVNGVARFVFGIGVLITIINSGLKAYRTLGRTHVPRHQAHRTILPLRPDR